MTPRAIEVLLVEDNTADVMLTREALEDAHLLCSLNVARDGVEALRFVRREGPYENAPRPDLILLDLNLPRKDGRKVLAELKADPAFASIPVVVLTSSRYAEDIQSAYGLHANAFVQKPIDLGRFLEVVRATRDYWFAIVTLPKAAGKEGTP